jgi:sorting nexin-4
MLDEDVFDSVTWETPSANGYDVDAPTVPSGPGYRQSTADGADSGGPNEPKWEGYLITTVKDPLKELVDTKDAYVSYLVTAEVHLSFFVEVTNGLKGV